MMDALLYALIALACSVFFSGIGVSFISSDKLQYELGKKKQNGINRILDIFFHHPNQFISTLSIGNNISLVVFAVQMAVLLEPWLMDVVANRVAVVLVQTLVSAVLVLLVGEFLPKLLFVIHPHLYLQIFAVPLYIIYILFYPAALLSSGVSAAFLWLVGGKNRKSAEVHTLGRTDLDYFLQQHVDAVSDNSEMGTEVKIFQNALEFSNVRLRDCMVPRTEIVACDKSVSLDELRDRFVETGLSKIIIYDKTIDNILGYIHSSELFKHPDDWVSNIHRVLIAPETMTANKMMKIMMREKKSIAIVVDEFGGISGMVTMEDLVEEIFGEIEDEHDVKSYIAKKLGDGDILVSGRMEIDALNEMFNLDIPESDEYVTVAGYILHVHQDFPKLNEVLNIGKYSFKIVRVSATKIELVRIKVGV